jgi:hypothetical protein
MGMKAVRTLWSHETLYHNERVLREGNIGPEGLEMQVILSDLEADPWDVRGPKFKHLHDPDMAAYGAGQALSRQAVAGTHPPG